MVNIGNKIRDVYFEKLYHIVKEKFWKGAKMIKSIIALVLFSIADIQAVLPAVNDGLAHGDPPYLLEDGWMPLINGKDLSGWKYRHPERNGWGTTSAVFWSGPENPGDLVPRPEPGDRIINTVRGQEPKPSDLVTTERFGDVELYLEFMVADRSNSGVYVHGLYEIQIWDSYGRTLEQMDGHKTNMCGAIYHYAKPEDCTKPGGVVPRVRVERPTGQWQSFHIWFQAPHFDAQGKKTANAKFLRVLFNGQLIHENVERVGKTLAAMDIEEAPTNPLMLQGDHGQITFRNIYIRPLRPLAKP